MLIHKLLIDLVDTKNTSDHTVIQMHDSARVGRMTSKVDEKGKIWPPHQLTNNVII